MTEESESYMRGWKAGYHNATLAERDRIIKLLPSILVGYENGRSYCFECGYWDKLYPKAIALIKGEQE